MHDEMTRSNLLQNFLYFLNMNRHRTVSYLYKYEWKNFCKVDIWHLERPDKGLHGL